MDPKQSKKGLFVVKKSLYLCHDAQHVRRVAGHQVRILGHVLAGDGAQRVQHWRGMSKEERHRIGHIHRDLLRGGLVTNGGNAIALDGSAVVGKVVLDGGRCHL